MKKYSLHPYGALFHAGLDRLNKFNTIVYDWKEDTFYKVNSAGYEILQAIEDKQPAVIEEIVQSVSLVKHKTPWEVKTEVEKFITLMLKRNVVIES